MSSHRLIEPTFHLEEKICKKHERLLEVYCRTDHTCICTACAEGAHKSHDIVSTDHEWKKKMVGRSYGLWSKILVLLTLCVVSVSYPMKTSLTISKMIL